MDRWAGLRGVPDLALSDTVLSGSAREAADGMRNLDRDRGVKPSARTSARTEWRVARPRRPRATPPSTSPCLPAPGGNVYADLSLLDGAGAVEALPELGLEGKAEPPMASQRGAS